MFGYTYTEIGDGGMQYSTIEVDGNTVGGLGALPAEVPAEVPPHWRVYFAVDDADAAVEKAVELGGSVPRPADGHAVRPARRPRRPAGRDVLGDQADDAAAELTPAWRGHRLDSLVAPRMAVRAALAQSVEHLTRNEVVRGSIPRGGSTEPRICGSTDASVGAVIGLVAATRRSRLGFWLV